MRAWNWRRSKRGTRPGMSPNLTARKISDNRFIRPGRAGSVFAKGCTRQAALAPLNLRFSIRNSQFSMPRLPLGF